MVLPMDVFRSHNATPQPIVRSASDDGKVGKKDNVVPVKSSARGSRDLYDHFRPAASHSPSSTLGAEASASEGLPVQEAVAYTKEALSDPEQVSRFMPGDVGQLDGSELSPSMSAPDQTKRPGLNRGRSHSQSGSSRRIGSRQSSQPQSNQLYHVSPSPNSQESVHATSGSPVGYQGPSPQYQVTSPPYEQRPSFGPQYTMPSQSPMSMVHTSSSFQYSQGYPHPGMRSQDSLMVSPGVHGAFPPMMQHHGSVYPYQQHSPETSSPHSFSSGYSQSQIAPSPPPISPMATQPSGAPVGAQHSPFSQTGHVHSLQYSSPLSPTQYPGYTAQSYATSPSMYQSQYAPSPYPQNFAPQTSEAEGSGTWWYLPHGAPPPSRQYEGVQPPYQAHYPMGYSHMGRRDTEPSYSPSVQTPSLSTPTGMFPSTSPHPEVQQTTSSDQLLVSSTTSPVGQGRASPLSPAPDDSGISVNKPPQERNVVRRSYHPNPPAQRSEWVMWAGNVPSDAVHDELWRFFKQGSSNNSTRSGSPATVSSKGKSETLYDGVSSIFLISRSNCAFVNFETETHLLSAIDRFNGKPLRPHDSRCPRLVCRVRRKDDDLKAGVGGQRGMGVHTRWIKEKGPKIDTSDVSTPLASDVPPVSPADKLGPMVAAVSLSSSDEDRFTARAKQSSSGSYASTNSSILSRYFPKRFFILKSLTQFDLDLSVEKGLWATQRHNEGILDQAYRTSSEVFLIFGVNKSGEFYGYAKMAGPVLQGEHRVSWASRTDSAPSSQSSLSPNVGRTTRQPEEGGSPSRLIRRPDQSNFFSPMENKLVMESPMPITTPDVQKKKEAMEQKAESYAESQINKTSGPGNRDLRSAPAELGPLHRKITRDDPKTKQSLATDVMLGDSDASKLVNSDSQNLPDSFHLDPNAPVRARRDSDDEEENPEHEPHSAVSVASPLHAVAEEEEKLQDTPPEAKEKPETEIAREGWGESFKIEWLCTERLPFFRTRHLRNPWNHDREIKVSRDGTELEPSVGQTLLDEWKTLSAEPVDEEDRAAAGIPKRGPLTTTHSTPLLTKDSAGGKGGTRR